MRRGISEKSVRVINPMPNIAEERLLKMAKLELFRDAMVETKAMVLGVISHSALELANPCLHDSDSAATRVLKDSSRCVEPIVGTCGAVAKQHFQ